MKKYERFDHTADLGLEICGRTKKELFANAALALFDVMIQEIALRKKEAEKNGSKQ